jgi:uncharacterized protein
MSDFDRNYATGSRDVGAGQAVAIDANLRAYMIRVYQYMMMGVGLTGVVAWLTFQAAVVTDANGTVVGRTSFGQAIFGAPAVIVLMLGILGLVMFISFRIQHLRPATALALFMAYAAMLGLMLSSVFLAYTGASITRVFFISAVSFGALSLYGYTTQRSLSAMLRSLRCFAHRSHPQCARHVGETQLLHPPHRVPSRIGSRIVSRPRGV